MARDAVKSRKLKKESKRRDSSDSSSESEDERRKETLRRREKRRKKRNEVEEEEQEEDNSKNKEVQLLFLKLHPSWRLEGCSLVFAIGYILTWIFIWFFRPALSFMILALMLFGVPLGVWWYRNREVATLDDCILHYAAGFFPAFIAVYFFQYVMSMLILGFHFGVTSFGFMPWPEDAYGPFEFILLALASYIALAIPEQVMKYKCSEMIIDERVPSKANLIYGVAFAFGFATAQAILLTLITHGAAHLFNVWSVVQTSAVTSLFGTPLHCLDTYLIGCKVVMKKKFGDKSGMFSTLFMPVVARGTMILQAVVFIYKGPYHGWLCLIPAFCLFLVMFIYTKRMERNLPVEYRQQVGYINLLGIGALPPSAIEQGARVGVIPATSGSKASSSSINTPSNPSAPGAPI